MMNDHQSHFSSKHMRACVAIIVVALIAELVGAGSGILLVALVCPLMMGAAMWMMMGRHGPPRRRRQLTIAP
jgi:hypothetical protein